MRNEECEIKTDHMILKMKVRGNVCMQTYEQAVIIKTEVSSDFIYLFQLFHGLPLSQHLFRFYTVKSVLMFFHHSIY